MRRPAGRPPCCLRAGARRPLVVWPPPKLLTDNT